MIATVRGDTGVDTQVLPATFVSRSRQREVEAVYVDAITDLSILNDSFCTKLMVMLETAELAPLSWKTQADNEEHVSGTTSSWLL